MNVRDWNDLVAGLEPRLATLRVRVYGSGGAPYHHLALAALFGADTEPIAAEAIRAGGLADVDVLVVPGGGVRAMAGLLAPLGSDGAAAIRGWVEGGGMYVGSCAGSFLPAAVGESFWTENPQARQLCMVNAQLFNRSDSEWAGLTSPGVGTVHVTTVRPRHWLARGLPPHFRLVHYNGPMFEALAGEAPAAAAVGGATLSEVTGVVRFAGATRDFTPGEAFLGAAPAGRSLFESGVEGEAHSAVAGDYGRGLVVLFGSHPEFGLDTVQLGWDEGVRLFGNALAHQAGRAGAAGPERGVLEVEAVRSALRDAAELASGQEQRFAELAERDPGPWAAPGRAPGFLGLEPQELWSQAAHDASSASAATTTYLSELASAAWLHADAGLEPWLHGRAAPDQDYGFVGLLPLLERIDALLAASRRALDGEPFALSGPYDAMDRHPYQLGLSSYLSAAGLAASALLAAVTVGRKLGDRAPLPSPRLLAALT